MLPRYFDHIDINFTSFIFQLFHQLVFGDKCQFNATVSTLLFLNAIRLFHFFQSIALVSVRIIHLVDRTSSNSSIGTPIWPLRGKDDINFYKFLYFFLVFKFDSYQRILLIEQCSLCMNYCLYKCFDISSDFSIFFLHVSEQVHVLVNIRLTNDRHHHM